MWFDIFKRELVEHLMSLRFILTVVLTIVLMALNGITFAGGDFSHSMNQYIEKQQAALDKLQSYCDNLAVLGIQGPKALYKRPSSLEFCATGRDAYLPQKISAISDGYGEQGGIVVWDVWHYRHYYTPPHPTSAVASDFVDIDWAFIVGFVLSLSALLLTFDGICGERQVGTLKLVLSNAVPRAAVMSGKFAAVMLVLGLALALGVGVNLLIIGLLGPITLTAEIWGKVGAMGLASIFYLAFFAGLGLLVSSRLERPVASLVTLLFIWVVFVVLLPNTTAGVISSLQGKIEIWKEYGEAMDAVGEKHRIDDLKHPNPGARPPYAYVKKFADYLKEKDKVHRQLEKVSLGKRLDQIDLGRKLNRITPFGVFQYALESLADTGLSRHYRFIESANRYREIFNSFIRAEDAGDSDSYHLMGLMEGMSQKSVPFEAVPIFKEDLSARATVMATAPDLLLLFLFASGAFMGAHLAFVRREIA